MLGLFIQFKFKTYSHMKRSVTPVNSNMTRVTGGAGIVNLSGANEFTPGF